LVPAIRIDRHSLGRRNGKPIAVPLNATALEVLRRQLGKHRERVFTYAGKPLATANTRAWRKALKRAGIEAILSNRTARAIPAYPVKSNICRVTAGSIFQETERRTTPEVSSFDLDDLPTSRYARFMNPQPIERSPSGAAVKNTCHSASSS
jgi:hypothetical protein